MEQKKGLTQQEVAESRKKFGSNMLTPPKATPWWKLYLEKFEDPIIIVLCVATVISLGAGFIHGDFLESIGIICAILLATGVGFWQEFDAQKKFDAMKSDKDFEPVKVRREGVIMEITKDQLVVRDVVVLSAGDEIPADIELYISTDLKVSEASMTGESVAISKHVIQGKYEGSGFAPNMLLRGTTIEQGLGEGVVVKVGDETEIGKTTRQASEDNDNETPLEVQLNGLADKITSASYVIAICMLVILNFLHWSGLDWNFDAFWSMDTLVTELKYVMAAVVVVIVAVPEGLPLSVTLALAFSMKTMAKENNLVKKMHACETIGAVNVIFSDKTGTLTQNTMSVVDAHVKPENKKIFSVIGALNSSANWSSNSQVLGNPTDSAILKYVGEKESKVLRNEYDVKDTIPFSSLYKYMVSSVEDASGKKSIFIKGAPEVIAKLIDDETFIGKVVDQQARGRRAISAAVFNNSSFSEIKQFLDSGKKIDNAQYIGSWFIEDPIREDVPEAIMKCYSAGIDVVMMTGDNLKTGSEIARQAGFNNLWAIEAKDFKEAIKSSYNGRKFPNVIARCTPNDKLEILKWAQSHDYVCAMTGDGVNDSPSLNYADVGIAMGSGTSVAKEAADIVLLDDAFPSIVTGIKWGRSLFKNIKNFLYFQLSINVSACLVALFGPLVGVEMPFTVIQFLWINLVMDSLAAIALASEPAEEKVLLDKPRNKKEFIINESLAKAIFGFGSLAFFLCLVVLYGMNNSIMGYDLFKDMDLTLFFASYMSFNWWNIFNARVIGRNKSIFDGITKNKKFIGITIAIILVTIAMVQIGGDVFETRPLSMLTWAKILIFTSPVIIVREAWFWITRSEVKETEKSLSYR